MHLPTDDLVPALEGPAPSGRRIYRLKPSPRYSLAFVILFFGTMAWGFGSGGVPKNSPASVGVGMFLGFLSTLFTLLCLYSLAQLLRYRLSINGSALTFRGLSRTLVIKCTDVLDWNIHRPSRGWPWLVLCPSDETMGSWRIPYIFATDTAFDDWLNAIPKKSPNAAGNQGSKRSSDQLAAADPRFGADRDERVRHWHSLVSLCVLLHMAAALISGWALLERDPNDLLLAVDAALPFAAAALVLFGGRPWTFSVPYQTQAPTLSLVGIPVIASVGLFARVPVGFYELDHAFETFGPIAGGLAMLGLLSILDRQLRRSVIGLCFALPSATVYSGAIILSMNARNDQAMPESYRAQVIERTRIVKGRSHGNYLTLAPWGPINEPLRLNVTPDIFDAAAGGHLCIDIRIGKAGMRWFRPHACGK